MYHTFQTSISHNLNYKANAFWNFYTQHQSTYSTERETFDDWSRWRHRRKFCYLFSLLSSVSKMSTDFLYIFLFDFEKKKWISVKIAGWFTAENFFSPAHCWFSSEKFLNYRSLLLPFFSTLISINATFTSTTLVWFSCIHYP